jgi:hypothetical protein
MVRVMKTYTLNFGTPVGKITMSSYPGCVSSTDDYFITGNGFVLMSTNLWIPRSGEYSRPARTNDGLPSFVRAIVATRLAVHPRMWANTYGFLSGIAGAKQWLITDYAQFAYGQPITNGTVFLVESLPKLMRFGDVSESLSVNGFFEVHGEPHFRQMREIFGLSLFGEGSYEEHLQSALLDKATTIDNLEMARQVFSEIEPARTSEGSGITPIPILSRHDVGDPDLTPIPEGAIDAKITSRCLVKEHAIQARSGPPHDEKYPPFNWTSSGFFHWPHAGLPVLWNFTWVNVRESGITSPVDDDSVDGAIREC